MYRTTDRPCTARPAAADGAAATRPGAALVPLDRLSAEGLVEGLSRLPGFDVRLLSEAVEAQPPCQLVVLARRGADASARSGRQRRCGASLRLRMLRVPPRDTRTRREAGVAGLEEDGVGDAEHRGHVGVDDPAVAHDGDDARRDGRRRCRRWSAVTSSRKANTSIGHRRPVPVDQGLPVGMAVGLLLLHREVVVVASVPFGQARRGSTASTPRRRASGNAGLRGPGAAGWCRRPSMRSSASQAVRHSGLAPALGGEAGVGRRPPTRVRCVRAARGGRGSAPSGRSVLRSPADRRGP